jgi:hypothetical protein
MDFKLITPYIHQYNSSIYNILLKNKLFFENYYDNNIQKYPKNVSNVMLSNEEKDPYNLINNEFLKIIKKYYEVTPLEGNSLIGIYKQSNQSQFNHSDTIHNHIDSTTITGVMYIDPPGPNEGGEIEFYGIVFKNTFKLIPQPGKIYMFPSWLYHTPLPQTSPITRISLNWGYRSRLRPLHKITKQLW